jgi:excisionase family DNA binding protein
MATDIMTTSEASRYLKVGIETLKRRAREGRIPAAKVGRSWRFVKHDLDEWLSAGGDRYEALVDKGLGMVMTARMSDPANREGRPLEEFLQERGL